MLYKSVTGQAHLQAASLTLPELFIIHWKQALRIQTYKQPLQTTKLRSAHTGREKAQNLLRKHHPWPPGQQLLIQSCRIPQKKSAMSTPSILRPRMAMMAREMATASKPNPRSSQLPSLILQVHLNEGCETLNNSASWCFSKQAYACR